MLQVKLLKNISFVIVQQKLHTGQKVLKAFWDKLRSKIELFQLGQLQVLMIMIIEKA